MRRRRMEGALVDVDQRVRQCPEEDVRQRVVAYPSEGEHRQLPLPRRVQRHVSGAHFHQQAQRNCRGGRPVGTRTDKAERPETRHNERTAEGTQMQKAV